MGVGPHRQCKKRLSMAQKSEKQGVVVSNAMQKSIVGYQYWFHRQLDFRLITKG